MTEIDFAALQTLLDKQAITEVLMRYSRAIDRQDFQLLKDKVYWPDATDDHILYEGGVEGLVEFCAQFIKDMPTMHLLGNILIEMQDSTHAFVETYHQAFHHMPVAAGRQDLVIFGRYLDTMEKRGNEWRIIKRTVAIDCYTDNPGTAAWESGYFAGVRTRGGAKPNDPLYRLHPKGAGA